MIAAVTFIGAVNKTIHFGRVGLVGRLRTSLPDKVHFDSAKFTRENVPRHVDISALTCFHVEGQAILFDEPKCQLLNVRSIWNLYRTSKGLRAIVGSPMPLKLNYLYQIRNGEKIFFQLISKHIHQYDYPNSKQIGNMKTSHPVSRNGLRGCARKTEDSCDISHKRKKHVFMLAALEKTVFHLSCHFYYDHVSFSVIYVYVHVFHDAKRLFIQKLFDTENTFVRRMEHTIL